VAVVQYTFTHKQYTERQKATIHITTQKTIHRTTQKMFGTVRTVPRLGELYPVICLTTEEKARKNLSQGSCTVPNDESEVIAPI
jgi:hypothetical protein